MSWRDDPATVSQMTAIRDFYALAIGYNNAVAKVMELRKNGYTKGQASNEITRLHDLKVKGQYTGPEE